MHKHTLLEHQRREKSLIQSPLTRCHQLYSLTFLSAGNNVIIVDFASLCILRLGGGWQLERYSVWQVRVLRRECEWRPKTDNLRQLEWKRTCLPLPVEYERDEKWAQCLLCRFTARCSKEQVMVCTRRREGLDWVIDQNTKWPHQAIPPKSERFYMDCN